MLNCSASLAMSTSVLQALPGKLDIKRHSPSILYFLLIDKALSNINQAGYRQLVKMLLPLEPHLDQILHIYLFYHFPDTSMQTGDEALSSILL